MLVGIGKWEEGGYDLTIYIRNLEIDGVVYGLLRDISVSWLTPLTTPFCTFLNNGNTI